MAEWSNALDLGSSLFGGVSSNLTCIILKLEMKICVTNKRSIVCVLFFGTLTVCLVTRLTFGIVTEVTCSYPSKSPFTSPLNIYIGYSKLHIIRLLYFTLLFYSTS